MEVIKRVMRSCVTKTIAFLLALGLAFGAMQQIYWLMEQQLVGHIDLSSLGWNEEDYKLDRSANALSGALRAVNHFVWDYHSEQGKRELEAHLASAYPEVAYLVSFQDEQITNVEPVATTFENATYHLIVKPESMDLTSWLYGDASGCLGSWIASQSTVQGACAENAAFDVSQKIAEEGWNANDAMYTKETLERNAQQDLTEEMHRGSLRDSDCIMLYIQDEASSEWVQCYQRTEINLVYYMQRAAAFALGSLLCVVYLLLMAGRKAGQEELRMFAFDKVFIEFPIILLFTFVMIPIGCWVTAFDWGMETMWSFRISMVVSVFCYAVIIACLQSIVRNCKNHTFWKRSAVIRCIKWAWKWCKLVLQWLQKKLVLGSKERFHYGVGYVTKRLTSHYSSRKVAGLFAVICIGFSVIGAVAMLGLVGYAHVVLLLAVLAFVALLWKSVKMLLRRIEGFEKIVDGLSRTRAGELQEKIEDCPAGVFQNMAEDINSIGDGLQAALQQEVRAERMKTELITNVSHDLKTPLTSILSYSDLLCRETLSPDEANDYAKIIQNKAQRLQQLTADLFEISKVQSGNDTFLTETLDMCTLVRQALAEKNSAAQDTNFEWKVSIPDTPLAIRGDGRKLARVFENLMQNCQKYTLKGTRIFVKVEAIEQMVVTEIKNIANYEMAFDPQEITERFVRGDEARATEGSGLGLAIAKSYVTGCGGTMDVIADGDLFKVVIIFPRVSE